MKETMMPIVNGPLGTIPKDLVRRLEELEIEDHISYRIEEIDQKTEKSPGDLRRLAITQILVKDHQLTLA